MPSRTNPPGPVAQPLASRPPPLPPPPAERRERRGVAFLLAVAAVLAALLGGRSALLTSGASDSYLRSTRLQVRDGALIVEAARFVFQVQGREALHVVEAEQRAAALDEAAGATTGAVSTFLRLEAAAQLQVAEQLRSFDRELFGDDRYRLSSGGFDLAARLDAEFDAPGDITPDQAVAAGDDASGEAVSLTAVTIPVALAFAAGALAQGFPARRRLFLRAGLGFLTAGALLAVAVETVL